MNNEDESGVPKHVGVVKEYTVALVTFAFVSFNPVNPELNPMCYLLALLAHQFLHVSRIRVKSLTIRLLMSYIRSAYS